MYAYTPSRADAYLAFHAAQSGYVESLGMDHEQGTETMRLLTLCSLAAASPVLSYDDVAKALQVRPRPALCMFGAPLRHAR